MKTCGGWMYKCRFLDLGTGLRLVVSFTPGDKVSDIHWIGNWMDPRTGLRYVEKRNF
jgi:hypothetical protein